jgi:hypothetical protein
LKTETLNSKPFIEKFRKPIGNLINPGLFQYNFVKLNLNKFQARRK